MVKTRSGRNTMASPRGGGSVSSSSGSGNPGGGGGNGNTFVTTVGNERPPSAGAKVGNSLQALLMGPFVVFLGCLLLWYNEKWAIKTHRSLNEALEAFVEIPNADDTTKAHLHRGKLAHMTHMLHTDGAVEDPLFGLYRPQAVSLQRQVEIYQWVETVKQKEVKKGDVTEVQEIVKYNKKWVTHPIDSDDFRHPEAHENCCGQLPMPSESFQTDQVHMGVYLLSSVLTRQLQRSTGVLPNQVKTLPDGAQRSGSAIYLPRRSDSAAAALPGGGGSDQSTIQETTMRIDGEERTMFLVKATGESYSTRQKALAAVERSLSTDTPEIGDVRVTFTEVPCALVSVLAKISGSSSSNILTQWQSQQGSGYEVAELAYGAVSANEMIGSAQSANSERTWMCRIGGWILNLVGFSMIIQIVTTTADITLNWIPLLGPMATSVINLGVSVAHLILANCTTLLVASIAWIFYRPMLGLSLLAGSLGLFYTASQMGKAKGTTYYSEVKVS
ncbi:Transmembrane protein 43 [Seminavis robusta]|uniref:Transmembrane protein 43 n=1 Tax=Seminavis robusta TaxID=568900 RepID=A0A9N8ETC4_9STRA|nr:Transmembrane protein 43 [Seminavis robusta]|eukprot:Sro1639_g287800.1 Transmembrane protein 43 (501) ;mRNA; f:6413-7915